MSLRPERSIHPLLRLLVVVGLVLSSMGVVSTTQAAAPSVTVKAPKASATDTLISVDLTFPAGTAAVDGRVLLADGAGELVGVAIKGKATGLRPEAVANGFAFGAYDLSAAAGKRTGLTLVVAPAHIGSLQLRVVVDAASDRSGARLDLAGTDQLVSVAVGRGTKEERAPGVVRQPKATHKPGKVGEAKRDGKIDREDLDIVRAAWGEARAKGLVCSTTIIADDVNADGCVDIVDVQATRSLSGTTVAAPVVVPAATGITGAVGALAAVVTAAAPLRTFTVNSTLDTADTTPGNGVCADAAGLCTLRAAMTEADYLAGDDRIEFNLPGLAPVTIQLGSKLPYITSRSGGVTIDGYSQPGSKPNTATVGSNAVPGVEIRGNGTVAKEVGIYITSPGNTIRGLVIGNVWRGMFVDGVNAQNNLIIGNWIGYTRTQAYAGSQYGIVLNTGSNHNTVGTPALADRNVIGNWSAGIDHYGPGTDYNVTQNNLFCIRPDGGTAVCNTGIDHNFGPKNGLIGGTGTNERNVFGPTKLQGIEYSHGYNPAGPPDTDFSLTYQINNNRSIGNWVGFKADGNYDPTYRSALNFSSADNGQGINVYDSANDNLVEGNYVASVYDGIQTMAPTSARNTIRNNIIGESPLGQPAPMTRWGIVVRWGSTLAVVDGNIIKNAAAGGIGLLNYNNAGQAQSPAYNIKLTRNIISGTSGPAIDLFGVAGPDPNDVNDPDSGANTLLNTPVFTTVSTSAIRGTGLVGATVEVYRATRPVGSFGLPSAYLGSAVVASNGSWTLARASVIGDLVTALQIAPDFNTSELAANVAVGAAPPEGPAFVSGTSTTFVVGTAGTFTISTTGTPTATVSKTGALPAGVVFTDIGNGSATLSGTPAAGTAGSYPLTLTASNGVSPDATQSFTLQVNAAPAFTSAASATFVAGSSSSFSVTTTGRPTATITRSGTLPTGVTFTDNGNGTGTLAGTPALITDGSYPLTFTAANGVAPDASQSFTLTVNPPVVGAPVASDTFSRTLIGSWGAANTGGAWTIASSSGSFSVDGNAGVINLGAGATRAVRLGSVSTLAGDMRVDVTTDQLPAGGNLFYYIVGRRTGTDTEYRAKVRIAANGMVFVQATKAVANVSTNIGPEIQVAGLVAAPGAALSIRVQYVGTSPTLLRMRVWAAGQAEPGTWATSQTDNQAELQAAGAVGLRAYLSSTTTNPPSNVSFDAFVVTP